MPIVGDAMREVGMFSGLTWTPSTMMSGWASAVGFACPMLMTPNRAAAALSVRIC